MRVGPVSASDIMSEGTRLTGGFHLSEDQQAVARLRELGRKATPLGDLCPPGGVFRGPIFKRIYAAGPEYGRPYVSGNALLQADVRPSAFLSFRLGSVLDLLMLQPGMILVTCSGMNLGRAIWARGDFDRLCGTHDLIRVRPDSARVPPGYVHAFLASRFGHAWIRKQIYGGNIKHVEPEQLADIPVPRLDAAMEERAHALVVEAGTTLTGAQRALSDTTAQFFASVGLQDITAREWQSEGPDVGFQATFPKVESLRALNFNPRFRRLCDRIRSGPWKPLGEICVPGTLKRGGRYRRIDAEPEYAYELIGQKQLFRLRPRGRWIARTSVADDILVDAGTTLVAARGTLGESELYCRAEFAWGSAVGLAYSEDILRIVADERIMPRGALFAFMRSESAFRMLRSISVGTKQQDHHNVYRAQIPVPYPSRHMQRSVHEEVVSAYVDRQRAVALEDEAVDLVESAIEEAA